tara:strand:- start:530 stop:1627 length:1098 start_codon:yes stop_codon:yes gene_type:complete
MKIISISTDRKIFEEGSNVRQRMCEYGQLCDELHIIVFTTHTDIHTSEQIADNVWVYATNSINKLFAVFDAYVLAKELIRKKKGDMITTQDPFETGLIGLLVKRKTGIPLHIQVHTDIYSPYFSKGNIRNYIRMKVAPYILKKADKIRAVSNRIKKSLIEKLGITPKKIVILPIYVPKNKSVPVHKDDGETLLTISRLAKEKNLFFCIDVIASVVKQKPQTKLVIVGDGPYRQALEKYAERKKLENNVFFEGWQSDLEHYFQHATAYISTSLYEGYGMTLIEASQHRVPIISSDVGIMQDVLIHNESAFVCSVNDKECFVQSITALLDNSVRARELAMQAYEATSKHLPENKNAYLEKYKQTLEI